jgi:large subunit ribosomal protein L13
VYKSYYPKASEIERKWVLVDAKGQNLGRIATRIAHVLLGKHKPTFTPGVEMGDYVVVVNAEGVTVTGTKTSTKMETKMYHRHSNYPGGYKSISLRDQLQQHPDRVLRAAVWGMLPHNRTRAARVTKEERRYGTVLRSNWSSQGKHRPRASDGWRWRLHRQ